MFVLDDSSLKKVEHVSASQLSTYRRCNRKWWWNKIYGLSVPSTEAMVRGKYIHRCLEEWLLKGAWPSPRSLNERDWLRIAKDGTWLHDKGATGTPDSVEPYIEIQASKGLYLSSSQLKEVDDNRNIKAQAYFHKHSGKSWKGHANQETYRLHIGLGTIPFLLKAVGYIDWLQYDLQSVADHKSTSGDVYKPSSMALKVDPQAILYTAAAILHHPEIYVGDKVNFRHYYYATRRSTTKRPVTTDWNEVSLTRQEISDGLDGVAKTITLMVADSTKLKPSLVTPNVWACLDYGKCPFHSKCKAIGDIAGEANNFKIYKNGNPYNQVGNLLKPLEDQEPRMSFLDKIARKEAAAGIPPDPTKGVGINPPDAPTPMARKNAPGKLSKAVQALASLTPDQLAVFKNLPAGAQKHMLGEVEKGNDLLEVFSHVLFEIFERNGELAMKMAKQARLKIINPNKDKAPPPKVSRVSVTKLTPPKVSRVSVTKLTPAATLERLKKVEEAKKARIQAGGRNTDDPVTSVTVGQIFEAEDSMRRMSGAAPLPRTTSFPNASQEATEGGPILYIDCVPRNKQVVYFAEWVTQFVGVVLRQHKANHYMLPPLDCGKGKNYIALEITRHCTTHTLPHMYVDSSHPLYFPLVEGTVGKWSDVVE